MRSGAIVAAVTAGEAMELVGDLELDLLHVGDVVELDAAVGAGVGDDERAAAEDRSITPISKSTPLIRLSGIVRPSLAMKPERLMKRRLVKV